MERLIELTAEYLRTRKQFGVPLASFQDRARARAALARAHPP
ncbi:acyl-CoA dehydrogenase [Bordetella pertussis]|nr:acyl-CoA dehydrogenase [Bordetella pertussis]